MSRFRYGWRPNLGAQPDGRDALRFFRARASLPPLASPDLRPFDGPINDQGQSGRCEAFTMSEATAITWRANQVTSDWVLTSFWWIYLIGRLQEFAGVDPELVPASAYDDTGLYPALTVKAIAQMGLVRLAEWPEPDPATLQDESAMLALCREHAAPSVVEAAFDQRGTQYGVYQGAGRMAWIAECLKNRLAVSFGHDVGDGYESNTGQVVQPTDLYPSLGGHAESIVAVNSAGNAIVRNHWGPDWGQGGWSEWSPAAIESTYCSDFMVSQPAPLPRVAG